MLTTASCWRECTRCFCFASPSNFAFTWATGITIHINSCPVKCSRNVDESGHFVDGRLTGSYPASTTGLVPGSRLVGSDLRARHQFSTDYGELRNNSLARLSGTRPGTARFDNRCFLNL